MYNLYTATLELQPGSSVNGAIDGKFENGYLITVNLGSDQLQGVLYHVPFHTSQSSYPSDRRSRRNRKKSRLALRDPSRPKSNRSGYNFFFAEHYARLKPMYYGQEKAISKTIGLLWNNLTEAEKQVCLMPYYFRECIRIFVTFIGYLTCLRREFVWTKIMTLMITSNIINIYTFIHSQPM